MHENDICCRDAPTVQQHTELKFQVNLYKPVNKYRTHSFVDVLLVFHVYRTNRCRGLSLAEQRIHVLNIFCGAQRIIHVPFVDVVDLSRVLVAARIDGNIAGSLEHACDRASYSCRIPIIHDRLLELGKAVLLRPVGIRPYRVERDLRLSALHGSFLFQCAMHTGRFSSICISIGIGYILNEAENGSD